MKVLVTGANGFIGSYIMDYLGMHGMEVVGISRNNDRNPAVVRCDLSKEIILDGEFDCIVHAAAQGPMPNVKLESYLQNNVVATQNLISFAHKKKIDKIIYLSTVSMFGDIQDEKINEEADICNPLYYGMSKYVAEQMLKEDERINACSLILPGVLGCDSNYTPWIKKVAIQMMKNERVVYFNGDALFNNLLYIDDLAQYVLHLLERPYLFCGFERYLLGSRQYLSINEMLHFLKEILNSDSELCQEKSTKHHFRLDIAKALENGFVSRDIKQILMAFAKDILLQKEQNLDWDVKAVFNKNEVLLVDKKFVEKIKEKAIERNGYRLCLHKNPDEVLQEMLIVQHRYAYVRPHCHLKNTESNIILEGSCLLLLFDDEGKLILKRLLDSKNTNIFKIEKGIYHSLIPLSELLVYYEPKIGPFDSEDNKYALWSPENDETDRVNEFIRKMIKIQ